MLRCGLLLSLSSSSLLVRWGARLLRLRLLPLRLRSSRHGRIYVKGREGTPRKLLQHRSL